MNMDLGVGSLNLSRKPQIEGIIEDKATPSGPLGKIEALALRLALIQETPKPFLNQTSLFLFAGDHGIAEEGVCNLPQVAGRQQLLNIAKGGATVCAFARLNRMMIRVVDAGLKTSVEHPQVLARRLSKGSANFSEEKALTREQMERGLRLGGDLVKARHKSGTNVIGFGTLGIGAELAADMILKYLCDLDCEELVAKDLETSLKEKRLRLYKSICKHHGPISEPLDLLMSFGGCEFAMMVGALIQCGRLGISVLIDGYVGAVISLLACRIAPELKSYLFACQASQQNLQSLALNELEIEPLLD